MRPARFLLLARCVVLGTLLWSCADLGPITDDRDAVNLTQSPGTRLSPTDVWVHSKGQWDADGMWIYYLGLPRDSGHFHLARVRGSGGAAEILNLGGVIPAYLPPEGDPGSRLGPITTLADGSVLCVAWTDTIDIAGSPSGVLRWVAPDSVQWLPELRAVKTIRASSVPDLILYRSGDDDDLYAYAMTSAHRRRLGTGTPLAFAPAVPEVLIRQDDGTLVRVSMTDGTRQPVVVPETDASILDARWDGDGIHLLARESGRSGAPDTYTVLHLASGEQLDFYETRFEGTTWHAQWLPGGDGMTFWQGVITDPCTWSSGCIPHAALYQVDVATGADKWIAGVRGAFGARLVFAADGHRAVYATGGVLYRLTIP